MQLIILHPCLLSDDRCKVGHNIKGQYVVVVGIGGSAETKSLLVSAASIFANQSMLWESIWHSCAGWVRPGLHIVLVDVVQKGLLRDN